MSWKPRLAKLPFPKAGLGILAVFWIFLSLASLSACSSSHTPAPIHQTFYVFGTEVNMELYATSPEQAQRAIHAVEQRFQVFNRNWHAWEPGGIVAKINAAIAQGQAIMVPEEVKQFILKSQRLSLQSEGYFNPAIGRLLALWGFQSDHWQGPPPTAQAIHAFLAHAPSMRNLHFKDRQLWSDNRWVKLDFGGNAKGLALDMAMTILQQNGIQNAIVNIGGDMRILGHKPNGEPWRIGIQDPFHPQGAPIQAMALQGGESIVTSGTYQRYFNWHGQTFSHLLNPKTGYPIDHEGHHFVSVTVIHPDATTADAAATAFIVAGPKHWRRIAKKMGITKAYLIDNQGKIWTTPGLSLAFKR